MDCMECGAAIDAGRTRCDECADVEIDGEYRNAPAWTLHRVDCGTCGGHRPFHFYGCVDNPAHVAAMLAGIDVDGVKAVIADPNTDELVAATCRDILATADMLRTGQYDGNSRAAVAGALADLLESISEC